MTFKNKKKYCLDWLLENIIYIKNICKSKQNPKEAYLLGIIIIIEIIQKYT